MGETGSTKKGEQNNGNTNSMIMSFIEKNETNTLSGSTTNTKKSTDTSNDAGKNDCKDDPDFEFSGGRKCSSLTKCLTKDDISDDVDSVDLIEIRKACPKSCHLCEQLKESQREVEENKKNNDDDDEPKKISKKSDRPKVVDESDAKNVDGTKRVKGFRKKKFDDDDSKK